MISEKTCSKCGEMKPLGEFGAHKKGVAGRQAACRACERKRGLEYGKTHREALQAKWGRDYLTHKERLREDQAYKSKFAARVSRSHRKRWIKQQYNLTPEEYRVMFEAQNGVCAICGKPETASNQWGPLPLAVDHDHATGSVRALLCVGCNHKLAIVEDRGFGALAEAYLERYRALRIS